LDCCSDGASLKEALDQAKQRGFAEDDPSDDLSGRDAARKLRILVRHGFGARLERIEVAALDESVAEQAREAAAAGMRLRQISRASAEGDRIAGCVGFERVARDSALGSLTQERNGLEILLSDGRKHFVAGRGAGRWPTTEAVMADLFEARRQRWLMPANSFQFCRDKYTVDGAGAHQAK
jgi:homoserine dehydrogenase